MLWDEPDDPFQASMWDTALGFQSPLGERPAMSRYVICYDVVDNRRRAKVADCLEGWGTRVQKSVFEALLEKPHLTALVGQLGRLIDPTTDCVNIYPVCAACDGRRVDLGQTVTKPEHQPWLIV